MKWNGLELEQQTIAEIGLQWTELETESITDAEAHVINVAIWISALLTQQKKAEFFIFSDNQNAVERLRLPNKKLIHECNTPITQMAKVFMKDRVITLGDNIYVEHLTRTY